MCFDVTAWLCLGFGARVCSKTWGENASQASWLRRRAHRHTQSAWTHKEPSSSPRQAHIRTDNLNNKSIRQWWVGVICRMFGFSSSTCSILRLACPFVSTQHGPLPFEGLAPRVFPYLSVEPHWLDEGMLTLRLQVVRLFAPTLGGLVMNASWLGACRRGSLVIPWALIMDFSPFREAVPPHSPSILCLLSVVRWGIALASRMRPLELKLGSSGLS